MFKRLLLPLDLTDKHGQAVHTAAELAKQWGGSVTLLHVVELIPGLSREEDRAFYDRLQRAAQQHMDKIAQALAAQKVAHQSAILFGHRVEEAVRFAAEKQCDLIVLTSPTFDPAQPALGWGSLSFKISVLAPIPVLLVKA
jgi:nucleotide-binding universal stress UspA family protein